MKSSLRLWCALGLVAAGIAVGIFAIVRWAAPASNVSEPAQVANQQKAKPHGEVAVEAKDVVSVAQHLSASVKSSEPVPVANNDSDKHGPHYYGSTPAVALDANPQVKSVVEAIQQKNHPERLSILFSPKPFDAKAFAADPTAYLNTIELGRAFQCAQPGPGVPRLRTSSPTFQRVAQGESTVLKVQTAPKAPVSFTSLDLGQFDNQLTAITVQADSKGFAEVKFIASPGTVENIHILAASPVASGQAKFTVYVPWPQSTAASANGNAEQIVSVQAK